MDAPAKLKMICEGNYDFSNKEVQPCINRLPWSLFGCSKAKQQVKGIKVPPVEQFKVQEGCRIYVFEAGLDPEHVKTIGKNSIHLYVTHNGKKISIATLSSLHPRVELDLLLTEGVHLSHTSLRRAIYLKAVYFNAFEFKPMRSWSSLSHTDKELWVAKVKPFQEAAFNPMDDGKKLYLLKAFSETNTEYINLHVRFREKYEKIGTLPPNEISSFCTLEYDSEFTLLHTSTSASVIFFRYTVPDRTSFQLRDLQSETNLEPVLSPPKKSDDPEYIIYKELAKRRAAKKAAKRTGITASRRGNAGPQVLKLKNISLVPAPLICATRFSKSLIGAFS